MIIRTQKTVQNFTFTGQVDVEFSTLETAYAKAYGEPSIDLNGTIPYQASAVAPNQVPFDYSANIGQTPPPAGGSMTAVAGTGGHLLNGSGTFSTALTDTIGFFSGAEELVGDFELKARIDYVDGGLFDTATDPTTVDGFRVGLLIQYGNDSNGPSVLFGWGAHNSPYNLVLWNRTSTGGGYVSAGSVALADPTGLYLRLSRSATTLTASYSTDNGVTWSTLGTVPLAGAAYRVGLFMNSGTPNLATALLSGRSLVRTADSGTGEFAIQGSKYALIRSQSPHIFKLDGRVDPEAEAKVLGWIEEVKTRLTTAKNDLMANGSPESSGQTITEV
jgi:hypothetical protein